MYQQHKRGVREGKHLAVHCAGKIAEDPVNCAVIAREVGAIQQLILMALSENEVVVEQACKTIGKLHGWMQKALALFTNTCN